MYLPVHLASVAEAAGLRMVGSRELYPAAHVEGQGILPLLVMENALGRAVISLMGAHLMSFVPAGGREMLWLSPRTHMKPGVAIRGGIPLCLPWFGPNAEGGPQHGFARTSEWSLVEAEALADGRSRVTLELAGDESVCAQWPHSFCFRLTVTVGSSLELELSAQNSSEHAEPFSFAFHTYLAVPDVAKAVIHGLEGSQFIDKLDNGARKSQQGALQLSGATDRIYLDVPEVQRVETGEATCEIRSASRCAVVWNAWENAKNIADIGEGNHVGYLCVERGDVGERGIVLQPEMIYSSRMSLSYL